MLNILSPKHLLKAMFLGLSSAALMLMFSSPILAEKVENSESHLEPSDTVNSTEKVEKTETSEISDPETEETPKKVEETSSEIMTDNSKLETTEQTSSPDYQPATDSTKPEMTEEEKPKM